jgi:hypothetical protein
MNHTAAAAHPLVAALAALSLLAASGCRVETHKNGNGDNEDVKVATPFGNMQVKTDDKAVATGVGLPLYPGAVPIKKEHGKDDGAADINMSFGSFQMRIKALSFHSGDSPEKILAFYRPALAKYGDVIQCDNDRPVGTPTKTSQGLTCDNKKSNHISVNENNSGKYELKAGSEQHQHIVAVDKDGDGTKLGLVALDLPSHMSFGDDKDDSDKQ